ncbi:MAG: hypothetical protein ACXWUG_25290 [Polyangiales bacterium]
MRIGLLAALFVLGCSSSTSEAGDLGDASVDSGSTSEVGEDAGCTAATCAGPGKSCVSGACVDDCRPSTAGTCSAGTTCDFTDGKCKDSSSACFLAGVFQDCGSKQCGPGSMCDGKGACVSVSGMGCSDVSCDASGRCWGVGCPCDRPPPRCMPATLEQLNAPEFVGSLVNGADDEGAFDLDFDDVCTAYAVTMISGPDYLRQLTAANELTVWTSTTNLNMGEVAVLRVPTGEFKTLGDVAATYICCATCGCVETGADGRLGVVHLDRTSTTRPLPNVLPAKATSGTGPFGSATLDTGPYALTWGADKALYAGNVETNGDFVRVDLEAKTTANVTNFLSRVTASTIYDLQRLLVAVEGGKVFLVDPKTGDRADWATLPNHVTSIKRDSFTGRVYAEIASTPPKIVEISADGKTVADFQTPPRLGRIAIAPDGQLYHLSVFPAVHWKSTKDSIVRWPLPSKR